MDKGDFLVPVTGLEPVRYCYLEILSLLCLPFHHTGGFSLIRIPYPALPVKRKNLSMPEKLFPPGDMRKIFSPVARFRATFRPWDHILSELSAAPEAAQRTGAARPTRGRGGERMNETGKKRELDLDEWLYGEEWIISER